MRGAVLLLRKNGVTVKTTYSTPETLLWFDGVTTRAELQTLGFEVIEDKMQVVLAKLHELREASGFGRRITGPDLLDLIRILEDV